ncbi:hypothetical protein OF83DRAFT_1052474 [Amylostereum chailletii]|nr:hypothetical protein OF83DRAFT_1052474 [Amylostereum chailletii]
MSEYWVSKKRYFCKYCDTYIADDAPSRQHHENGMRHKGNKERFVRGLYKAGEKRKKDLEEEKREMARIDQAAQAAFAQDVGAGHAKVSSASSSRIPPPPVAASSKKPPKPAGAFSNYSTAESLGYTDPDIEHARVEAERRQTQGYVGEWQFIDSTPSHSPTATSQVPPADVDTQPEHDDGDVKAGTKRTLEEDDEGGRGWKLRKKTASVGLGELYDPGIIPVKPRLKKEEITEETADPLTANSSTSHVSQATTVPKWTATKWRKAGESSLPSVNHEDADTTSTTDPVPVKEEPAKEEEIGTLTIPAEAPSGGSMFRKRRVPAGGGAGARGRRC